jgi:hypothetical protein
MHRCAGRSCVAADNVVTPRNVRGPLPKGAPWGPAVLPGGRTAGIKTAAWGKAAGLAGKKSAVTNAVNLRTWWVRKSERRWVRFRERRGPQVDQGRHIEASPRRSP